MIHQIRLTTKSYAQIRREDEKCPYCEQLVRNKSKHWCVDCPAMVLERELMLEHLTSEQLELRDVELAVAIINSQNSRKYRTIIDVKEIPDLTAAPSMPQPVRWKQLRSSN